MDKIVVGIASIRRRRSSLINTINSLLNQTVLPDEINVYLNDYNKNKIKGIDSPIVNFYDFNDEGDLGDVGKYYKVDDHEGYYFSVDDDLKYPDTYIEYMINCIEKFNREYVVSLHGSIFNQPINDFIDDRSIVKFRSNVKNFTPVHLVGSGVTAFHTDTINIKREHFEQPNMADVWFSLQTQKQKVGIVVVPHKKKYVVTSPITDIKSSIFWQTKENDDKRKKYTEAVNRLPEWKIFAEVD